MDDLLASPRPVKPAVPPLVTICVHSQIGVGEEIALVCTDGVTVNCSYCLRNCSEFVKDALSSSFGLKLNVAHSSDIIKEYVDLLASGVCTSTIDRILELIQVAMFFGDPATAKNLEDGIMMHASPRLMPWLTTLAPPASSSLDIKAKEWIAKNMVCVNPVDLPFETFLEILRSPKLVAHEDTILTKILCWCSAHTSDYEVSDLFASVNPYLIRTHFRKVFFKRSENMTTPIRLLVRDILCQATFKTHCKTSVKQDPLVKWVVSTHGIFRLYEGIQSKTFPMPTPRTNFAAVELSGEIWVMGGFLFESMVEDPLSIVEIFDIHTLTWRTGPSMTIGRADHKAVSLGDAIFVVGSAFVHQATSCELFANQDWAVAAPLPDNFVNQHMSLAYFGDSAIATSWDSSTDDVLSSCYCFQGDHWSDPVIEPIVKGEIFESSGDIGVIGLGHNVNHDFDFEGSDVKYNVIAVGDHLYAAGNFGSTNDIPAGSVLEFKNCGKDYVVLHTLSMKKLARHDPTIAIVASEYGASAIV